MTPSLGLPMPCLLPPLDPGFRPAVLANRAFRAEVAASGVGVPLLLALERPDGSVSHFASEVFPEGHPRFPSNFEYVERIFKFLLWARGGARTYLAGPAPLADHLRATYSPEGARAFDHAFMGADVYDRPFEILHVPLGQVPQEHEVGRPLGRHLEGCRIGFDLGASDRKVSAVVDGEAIFSEEVVWEPRKASDPDYHYREIKAALDKAAGQMPRLDAIGGSSAGVIVNNQIRIASLFRGVPADRYGEVRTIFHRLSQEYGVPFEVVNDGDVTALAGAMSLEEAGVLGIALGSSEAAGYVNLQGNILGWLSELAFAPIDYSPEAPRDEWSGDRGVGAMYLSQQAIFRLAPKAGIGIPEGLTDADRLKHVQAFLEAGHDGARQIWRTQGLYLGYAIAHYAEFYPIRHLLILGRCTSGMGGEILLESALEVLRTEFPDLADLNVQLPDEKSRRVGQSIAAASLPALS